jgi:hypothetical protein
MGTFARSEVARWHFFKPKISIWGNFGGSCNGRKLLYYVFIGSILWPFFYILWLLGLFYSYLVYFSRFGI